MKVFLQPTLLRRVVLALLVAFCFLWVVLVAYSYGRSMDSDEFDKNSERFGKTVVAAMANMSRVEQVKDFAMGLEEVQNKLFALDGVPMVLALQVWDKQDKPVYISAASGFRPLHGTRDKMSRVSLDKRSFSVYRGETLHWTIVVAQSMPTSRWALAVIARDLAPYLLIAFVTILVPIWIAVSQGLRPLREMSQRIAMRAPDDLSATGLAPRYEEMKPLQQALDALLAKLRSKVERETAFVQEAAHELRTPLAVVSAQAHVLGLAQDPAERAMAEQRLEAALARTSHLIGQLLQLAHVGGERALNAEPIDLAQDVRDELAALAPSAMARSIDLSLESPDTLVLHTERHTFKSILHNLVGNAIRYVREGDKVVVSLMSQGDHVLFRVADNGPGIPPTQQELVFERFHRGSDHANSGAGLGLAIVREASARLGGSVGLGAGIDGRGCEFTVSLPCRPG